MTSHPEDLCLLFPCSVCPSSGGCRVMVESHSFHMFTKCQVPGSLPGNGDYSSQHQSSNHDLPCSSMPLKSQIASQDLHFFPEGSLLAFRALSGEIGPLSWPPPHPCPQPAAFHNSMPILFLPSRQDDSTEAGSTLSRVPRWDEEAPGTPPVVA